MISEPEIKDLETKKLVGICIATSLADDKTSLLWNRFMNLKGTIANNKGKNLYSVQEYGENFIKGDFDTQSQFKKWAATEVSNFEEIPKGLEKLEIPGGKYAVFTHKGTAKEFSKTSTFIFNEWLPNSGYVLDDRLHFEILGEEYKGPENPDSEEQIWIPIKNK
ncbi:GyrI-like domain-containing protein [Christiangramia sp. SM2212]|uniref:GyrI-like domain-containing protein n=1 Tax=Christiangramia sediminicola TaxID=3073267 RepID=A0ABU1EQW0_9FLAO|nr:GyrI-like domain-containing protein [Christiangramia sp. SM2212]MDR5590364.1 GyrI-like domain-containing protein [Christiangramia sp. SM2212]